MAGERDERAESCPWRIPAGGNLRPQAMDRLCFWLRGRYATGADSRDGCSPTLRWFRRETLLPGQPKSRTDPTLLAILRNLALGIVVNLPFVTVELYRSIS